jgi:hypothetical protein
MVILSANERAEQKKNCISNDLQRQKTSQANLEGRRTVPVNLGYTSKSL